MTLTNAHILSSVGIILVIHFDFYLFQRKSGLSYQVIDFKFQVFVFDLLEFVEIYCRVRKYPRIKNSDD